MGFHKTWVQEAEWIECLAPGEGEEEQPAALLLPVFYGMLGGVAKGTECNAAELSQQSGIISKYFKLVGTLENWRQRNLSGL